MLAPIVACAFCPACISAWAPLLATLGVGLALTESEHAVLLCSAIALSVGVATQRAIRTRTWLPAALSAFGAAAMLTGHALHENLVLTSVGVLGFLSATGSSIWIARPNTKKPPTLSKRGET